MPRVAERLIDLERRVKNLEDGGGVARGLGELLDGQVVLALAGAGLETAAAVQAATDEELDAIDGIGPATLRKIRAVLPAIGE